MADTVLGYGTGQQVCRHPALANADAGADDAIDTYEYQGRGGGLELVRVPRTAGTELVQRTIDLFEEQPVRVARFLFAWLFGSRDGLGMVAEAVHRDMYTVVTTMRARTPIDVTRRIVRSLGRETPWPRFVARLKHGFEVGSADGAVAAGMDLVFMLWHDLPVRLAWGDMPIVVRQAMQRLVAPPPRHAANYAYDGAAGLSLGFRMVQSSNSLSYVNYTQFRFLDELYNAYDAGALLATVLWPTVVRTPEGGAARRQLDAYCTALETVATEVETHVERLVAGAPGVRHDARTRMLLRGAQGMRTLAGHMALAPDEEPTLDWLRGRAAASDAMVDGAMERAMEAMKQQRR